MSYHFVAGGTPRPQPPARGTPERVAGLKWHVSIVIRPLPPRTSILARFTTRNSPRSSDTRFMYFLRPPNFFLRKLVLRPCGCLNRGGRRSLCAKVRPECLLPSASAVMKVGSGSTQDPGGR